MSSVRQRRSSSRNSFASLVISPPRMASKDSGDWGVGHREEVKRQTDGVVVHSLDLGFQYWECFVESLSRRTGRRGLPELEVTVPGEKGLHIGCGFEGRVFSECPEGLRELCEIDRSAGCDRGRSDGQLNKNDRPDSDS